MTATVSQNPTAVYLTFAIRRDKTMGPGGERGHKRFPSFASPLLSREENEDRREGGRVISPVYVCGHSKPGRVFFHQIM